MGMRQCFLAAAALFALTYSPVMAAKKKEALPPPSTDADRDNVILEIDKVQRPYEKDDYVVFTAKHNARYIGIAFDFERFAQVHPFNVRTMTDENEEVRDSLMYYVLKRPKNVDTFSYRLVIDGLWACDPNNDDRYYDENTGLMLSRFKFAASVPSVTEAGEETSAQYEGGRASGVHFVFRSKPGQRIRLSASFTNWDPWIYEMKETSPGLYEISLPLPPGTYYYVYYAGLRPTLDRGNPNRAYNEQGNAVSVITVK